MPDTIRMKDRQSPNILENTNFDIKKNLFQLEVSKKKMLG